MSKIILTDRMLVSKDILPLKAVKQRYKIELYNEKECVKCDNLALRPNDLCENCPAFIAKYKLFKEHNDKFWSLPQGDYDSLASVLDKKGINYKTVEKRQEVPFKFKIKFTGKLFGEGHIDENGIPRPNQKKLVKKWMNKGNGIIQAKPRSGKTVMSSAIVCKLKQRAVIMADRKELLKQFYKTFMGDPKKGRPAMSNIPELQELTGKEIIRIANSPKDLKNLKDVDILLLNYQKLVRRPKDMAKLIENKFSVLVVDEVHGSGAEGYLRVVSNCSVRHRLSLTATPRRKDNRHRLINRIMGGVVAKSESASLLPTIMMKRSEVHPPRSYSMWHHALAWISNNTELQKEILKQVFKDLRAGHEVIIIPLDRKKQINKLAKMINHQAKKNREKGEKWPKELAVKFYDGVDRDTVLDTVDAKGPTVLLAMRSMIKQGIDFSRPSMLYVYIPMSASIDKDTGAPMMEQLSNRVCTPAKKPTPIVRVWIHNVGMFESTIKGLFWQEIWPNRRKGKEGKYIVDMSTMNTIKDMNAGSAKKASTKSFEWA